MHLSFTAHAMLDYTCRFESTIAYGTSSFQQLVYFNNQGLTISPATFLSDFLGF
jgi:hypothetical protein